MSLSELMSRAHLSLWAEAALVLFLLVFVGVALRLWLGADAVELRRRAALPLDDAEASPRRPGREEAHHG